jgi:hypothetical protein
MYITAYALIGFVAGLAPAQVQPVQLDRFKTQTECVAAADQARAQARDRGREVALVCVPIARTK